MTRNGKPGQMVCFDVVCYGRVIALLSTYIAYPCSFAMDRIVAKLHHWFDFLVQLLKIGSNWITIENGNCFIFYHFHSVSTRIICGVLLISCAIFLCYYSGLITRSLNQSNFCACSKTFQLKFCSKRKKGIQVFLAHFGLSVIEEVRHGHNNVWLYAPHVDNVVAAAFALLQKIRKEWAWWYQHKPVHLHPLTIITGQSDIREVFVIPSIALYYISLLIGFGKYSIEWQPPICVCRLEMELLRPQYAKFDPVFCKMLNVHMWSPLKKFLGDFYSLLGGSGKLFFRGTVVSRNMWLAAENVVVMGNPYVLKGSSPFAEYVVCRGKCGLPRKMCHIFWRGALWQTVGEEFLNHHYVFILRDNVRKIIMKKKHR